MVDGSDVSRNVQLSEEGYGYDGLCEISTTWRNSHDSYRSSLTICSGWKNKKGRAKNSIQSKKQTWANSRTENYLQRYRSQSNTRNRDRKKPEYFFEITKPVLVVYNETLNYSFEVDIDDFANSWYLHVNDSNSEYKIELGRRPIPVNYSYMPDYDIEKNGPIEELKTPYFYISSSNELDAPNDRILFNKISKVYFRNVKTNELIEKDISDFPNIYKDGIFINIYKLYQELYKEEIKNDSFNLYNPSSGNISSGSFSSRFY